MGKPNFQPPRKRPPQKRKGVTYPVSISIPREMLARIEHEAKKLQTDRSSYIRSAIEYVWQNAPEYAEAQAVGAVEQ